MMYNDVKKYFSTLKWSDIFTSENDFINKIVVMGYPEPNFNQLDKLYRIMARKYAYAETRYTTDQPFVMAIVRLLQEDWPSYLRQEELLEQIHQLSVDEVRKASRLLINMAGNPNDEQTDAADVAIQNYSTEQQSHLNLLGKFDALKQKYSMAKRDNLSSIYKKLDTLFTQMLTDDYKWVYQQEEEV